MSHFLDREQPAPVANDGPDCWKLVLADMERRRQNGIAKYGQPVRPHNGRNALQDGYEEALDKAVYLRQAMEERERDREQLCRLHALLLGASIADWDANRLQLARDILEGVLLRWPAMPKED